MKKVGIIILTYNRSDIFDQCLQSISEAGNEIPIELFVFDNNSDVGEYSKIQKTFLSYKQRFFLDGMLIRSEVNYGFPKGNNQGLNYFLDKKDISHICFLNSDVIVTPKWLTRLLADDYDVVGPVTNACGNEQTIPIDFKINSNDKEFIKIYNFAEKRYQLYKYNHVTTNFLGFFCFIAKFAVIKQLGLLDEQFGLGTYEDDDYCERILAKAIKLTILRDVFVYHHGTASFSQIKPEMLITNLSNNKSIFEAKHNKLWNNREYMPIVSFQQDLTHLLHKDGNITTLNEFNFYFENSLTYIETVIDKYKSNYGNNINFPGITRIYPILNLRNIRMVLSRGFEFFYLLITKKTIIFLTKYPNATESKDGYFQRVLSIDSLFHQYLRVYLHSDQKMFSIFPFIQKITPKLYDISFSDHNPIHKLMIFLIKIHSGRIYCHSVLRLDRLFYRKLFKNTRISVFDVHGAVPEEFDYCYNDKKNHDLYNTFESFAIHHADKVLTVSKNMRYHLEAKHEVIDQSRFILLPNLNISQNTPREKKIFSKESIVYSGGLQKWQQLDMMLSYVQLLSSNSKVTFIVHDPDKVKKRYKELYNTNFPGIVVSVDPKTLDKWYPKFSFGLILREDHILNRVACPTKIIEYIQHDIVPIVDFKNIGDFADLNLATVSVHEKLPGEDKWEQMIANNRQVLETIYQTYHDGRKELYNCLITHS